VSGITEMKKEREKEIEWDIEEFDDF